MKATIFIVPLRLGQTKRLNQIDIGQGLDLLKMPVQREYLAVVFFGDYGHITVRKMDCFPFFLQVVSQAAGFQPGFIALVDDMKSTEKAV